LLKGLIASGEAFWSRHPALFIGICFFIGTSLSLHGPSLCAFDLCLLPLLFHPRRLVVALFLICVATVTTSIRVHVPTRPFQHFGTLQGEVVDRHLMTFHGKPVWRIQLAVEDFCSSNAHALLRGCSFPLSCPPPCALQGGAVYRFSAHVHVDDQLRARIRPFFANGVETVRRRFSLVEWRHSMRRALEQRFVGLFPDQSLRHLAGGLTFGLYKDPLFQKAMHRAGVEHVLAVSGFHFGIVAALTIFLAKGLAPKRRSIVAMVCLTLYLLLIGPLPSVVRAWTAAMVVLGGICLNRSPSGLNCLGVGLIVSVLYDPASVTGIGYQLSYLATAAILFFSRPTLNALRLFVPSRSASDALTLSKTDQGLLFLLEWLLPALSLLIPVFLVLCPYQLTFLQDFSLLGLVYNLLIPALFSLAMPAVLLAVLLSPLPLIPSVFTFLASIPLRMGLVLVEHTPETSWSMVSGGIIPKTFGLALLLLVLLAGIVLKGRADEERADAWKACL
jgi:ComEC/Rec2-related protein